MDRYSPVAPARIRVLVLPVGSIELERKQYTQVVEDLRRQASIIPLREIDPDNQKETLVSPAGFRAGSLLLDYITHSPSEEQRNLSPFELHREPLLALGVCVGEEREDGSDEEASAQLLQAAEQLQKSQAHAVYRHLFALGGGLRDSPHDNVTFLDHEPPTTPCLSAMKIVSALFLRELNTYAQAQQAVPTVQTPGRTAQSLQRASSRKAPAIESRPSSGYGTPIARSELDSPTDHESRSPPRERATSPPASFEQITNGSSGVNGLARSDSRASNRPRNEGSVSSQERVAIQGFGSSNTKAKDRGKARVGIVVATIRMMAGHWDDALANLIEHTNKARQLSDSLWHAKGLENMMICMILLAWAGLDFSIPTLCLPGRDRSSMHIADRFSATSVGQGLESFASGTPSQRLARLLPDLLPRLLNLYHIPEGSLELDPVVSCEAAIRFSKLLAIQLRAGGDLSGPALSCFVEGDALPTRPVTSSTTLSKASIAKMIARASLGTNDHERSHIIMADQVPVLAGIASVYALIGFDRKKVLALKELIVRLTAALLYARKLGAAEAGMHPAASLISDPTSLSASINAEEAGGLETIIEEVAHGYNISPLSLRHSDEASLVTASNTIFEFESAGSMMLKHEVLRVMISLCEAHANPAGVLNLTAAFLRLVGPKAVVDTGIGANAAALQRDEQSRLASMVPRSQALANQMSPKGAAAPYWDLFLVRGVELIPVEAEKRLINRRQPERASQRPVSKASSENNPLLYDPNAVRSSPDRKQTKKILVMGEQTAAVIHLQNPYDISIDIEQITLMTEEGELATTHARQIKLQPLCLQQVHVLISPTAPGEHVISGCRVKFLGCEEQTFRIFGHPWAAQESPVVKNIGIKPSSTTCLSEPSLTSQTAGKDVGPEWLTIPLLVVDALPFLVLEKTSLLEDHLMLLDGEKAYIEVTLKNTSTTPAFISNIINHTEPIAADPAMAEQSQVVSPEGSAVFTCIIFAKAGVVRSTIEFIYYRTRAGDNRDEYAADYARALSVSIRLTVQASLRVDQFQIKPVEEDSLNQDSFGLSFVLMNLWPRPVSFQCF
ncbi:hypothetical protein K431DRAFT_210702, partial [Polychaeton citri CBS 116435]